MLVGVAPVLVSMTLVSVGVALDVAVVLVGVGITGV